MDRRIVGIVLAVLLGVVGTFVLARYVQRMLPGVSPLSEQGNN